MHLIPVLFLHDLAIYVYLSIIEIMKIGIVAFFAVSLAVMINWKKIACIYGSGLLWLLYSCHPVERVVYDESKSETIRVLNMKCVHSDSVFSHIEFVPLETHDDCFITKVWQVEVNDSLLFVNDSRQRILVFARDGKFKYQIGRRGNGPDEYMEIRDMLLHGDTLEVLDFKKIECYDISGKHLIRKKFDLLNSGVSCNPRSFARNSFGGYYFWERILGRKAEKRDSLFQMHQVDSDFHVVSQAFPQYHAAGSNSRKFVCVKDTLVIDPIFADPHIYQIAPSGRISIRYTLDFGEKTATFERMKKVSRSNVEDIASQYVLEMMDYAENTNWVHLAFFNHETLYNLFYHKNNKKVYLLSPSLKNTQKDDCRFWSVQVTFGEQMIYCIDALWFLDLRESLSEEARRKYGLDRSDLVSVTENSNPVVAIYSF